MLTDWRRGDRNQPTWCACASTRRCPTESCSTSILYEPPPAADAAVFAGTEFCQSYTSAASKLFTHASSGIIRPCIVRSNSGIVDGTDPNFLILSDVFQHVLFLYVDIFFMFVFSSKCIHIMGSYVVYIICETSTDIHVCFRPHTNVCWTYLFLTCIYPW